MTIRLSCGEARARSANGGQSRCMRWLAMRAGRIRAGLLPAANSLPQRVHPPFSAEEILGKAPVSQQAGVDGGCVVEVQPEPCQVLHAKVPVAIQRDVSQPLGEIGSP